MTHFRPHLLCFVVASIAFGSQNASAQTDRIYASGASKAQIGTVTEVTKDGVKFKTGANVIAIPSETIDKILFKGDPSGLTKAREFMLDNQYQQANAELKKLDFAKINREVVKADAQFYLAESQAQLALSGRGKKAAAAKLMSSFVAANKNNWHFYQAAKTIGDLALAINDHKNAEKWYGYLARAASPETKMQSVYLTGVTKLAKGDGAGAMGDFEKIIGVKADTPGKVRLQTLSKAGKAVVLAKSGKGAEGLKLVDSLIAELNPTDVEMAAKIYNAQGASCEASGDSDGAILAYLHTHLMFSTQPDAHAQALSKLITLWEKVGKPDRAAQARQEMQQRYPGFGS